MVCGANDKIDIASRIWNRDADLWSGDAAAHASINNRLGWLDSVGWMQSRAAELQAWADEMAGAGFERVLLLGMGGSSLAPEVFAGVFPRRDGYPTLDVLDNTSPEMVAKMESRGLEKTLFVVASKSGGTVETSDFMAYFFERMKERLGDRAADHFVTVTDGGSELEKFSREAGFRKVFVNPGDIGGRYSVLSYFGLVPAALIGVDIDRLLQSAVKMLEASKSDDPGENSALALGCFLGDAWREGRDKMTLLLSPGIRSFGAWVEQLVAESTGKTGKGIVPVDLEPVLETKDYGADRLFVATALAGEKVAPEPSALEQAGHPLMAWNLVDEYELGGEFFKWEFATAVAGAVLAVNPFDEPNVAEAKAATRAFISGEEKLDTAQVVDLGNLTLQVGGMELPVTGDAEEIPGKFIEQFQPGEYLGILVYIPPQERTTRLLEGLRRDLGGKLQAATTLGYGPRYLHSTGQLHKGGAANGRFIQIVGESGGDSDLAIPGREYSFGQLYQAQADGDYAVLQAKPRPVLRVTLKGDRQAALESFRRLVQGG